VLGIALFSSFLALVPVQDAPPGLVLVKGGKTKIGTPVDEVEKLVLAREELRNVLAAQTPQFSLEVDSFFLMPTEVTNEQYLAYVQATGAQPPRSWGVKDLQAGQAAFLLEQSKLKQEAKAAGQSYEMKLFDAEAWWDENWKSVSWQVPAGEETRPVVFVSYADAQNYARWAGLRLMTEFEFQRAARGDTGRSYPWGEEWDDRKYCQSLHIGKDLTADAGSYPDGAVNGIFDLAGNVWEWTSSPFNEYPGYKQLRFSVKKRAIECLAPFDPNQRVTVSGSYQIDKVGVRIPTRMNTDRTQSTSALGFRCAASEKKGVDAAAWVVEQDLNLRVLGTETQMKPDYSSILRRWSSVPGTSKVPGYAVITGYEQILLCPREEVKGNSTNDLESLTTKEGPLFIGFIQVPLPMLRPELDAGTYLVAWRAAGKLPEEKEAKDEKDSAQGMRFGQEEIPFHQVPGFSIETDCYIFYTPDGTPQVAVEAPPLKIEKMADGAIKNEPFVAPPAASLPKDAPPPVPIDTLRFTLRVQSSSSKSKGFLFDLPVLVKPGTYDASWK